MCTQFEKKGKDIKNLPIRIVVVCVFVTSVCVCACVIHACVYVRVCE